MPPKVVKTHSKFQKLLELSTSAPAVLDTVFSGIIALLHSVQRKTGFLKSSPSLAGVSISEHLITVVVVIEYGAVLSFEETKDFTPW